LDLLFLKNDPNVLIVHLSKFHSLDINWIWVRSTLGMGMQNACFLARFRLHKEKRCKSLKVHNLPHYLPTFSTTLS
jgi:hypothetical protein